jgi:uncharacterized protein (TIGR02302 family)
MSDDLNRKIGQQRVALYWESLWHAVQRPLLAIGIAVIVLASDALSPLPKYAQLALLAILAAGFLYALKDLLPLKAPSRRIAMRRIEIASKLDHRVVSSHQDELVAEIENPKTSALWEEHQRRNLANLENVKISPPKSAWRKFDPLALRVPVALAALAALLLGPGDMLSNARNAGNIAPAIVSHPLTIDAWLKPPAYTGKPPLLLTSPAMQEKLASGSDVSVPENASLTLRVQGAEHPHLAFYSPGVAASAETEIKSITPKTTNSETGFASEVKLDRPVIVKLLDGSKELASWPIILIPDEPPKVKIVGEPKSEKLGALNVGWEASDDYGVKSITAEISLSDQQETGLGFESNGVFLFDPPVFKIALRSTNSKSQTGNTTQDLSSHPWAGLYVEMVLTATDGAGHSTATQPARFKMPQRMFSKPLAKALIEQRGKLILSPDEAPNVATMLDAILAYPYSIADRSRLILNLAAIKSSLTNAGDTDTVTRAVTDLWPLAVTIEDGEMADARAELKALKEQLQQALRDGAPPEKIAELTDKMRKAMDKLIDQMRKEAEKRKADGQQSAEKQNGREITKEELQKMLDQIEKLSKSGSKEAAEQMLSELDKLLQNLQPGNSQAMDPNGDPGLQQKMDELSDLMRRQQQLMDQTQRLPQTGNGDQPGDQPGESGKDGQGSGLSDKQGTLADRLDRLNRDLGGGTENFGDASKNMKDAQGSLRQGSKEDALRQQGEAMKQMQDGAKKLGKKLAQQGQGKTGEQGHEGQAGGNSDDPLGRPRASTNPDTGPNKNTVPSELATRRAREILEQLHNRSNEQNLGETERGYIERLLKGLY